MRPLLVIRDQARESSPMIEKKTPARGAEWKSTPEARSRKFENRKKAPVSGAESKPTPEARK